MFAIVVDRRYEIRNAQDSSIEPRIEVVLAGSPVFTKYAKLRLRPAPTLACGN
jgi:hypothetical protein